MIITAQAPVPINPVPVKKPTPSFGIREVFIGGAPRSGTSLLLSLLDSHQEMLVFPTEIHLFDQGIKRVGANDAGRLARCLLSHSEIAHLFNSQTPPMGYGGIAPEMGWFESFDYSTFERNFLWRVRQRQEGGPRHVLHSLFRAYAETRPATHECPRIFVEKTPANDYYSEQVFKYFPEAKLIQIIRDPRAVYASRQKALRQRRVRHSKSFRLVNEWNRNIWQCQRLRDRPDQFLSIRYEDLLADPKAILNRVCEFIGISARALTLAPTKAGQQWQGNSSYGDSFKGISTIPLDRWKDELCADEVAWIEYHCQQGMRDCGYPFLTDLSSPAKNWQLWLRPLPYESWLGYLKARRASLCWKFFPGYMMRVH
jgi:hypothetical protein